ncbi:AMP-binding protein [Amycolatopsis sp. NPDC026612]|uniref:AMP-binding protein n=1 Tax=Amycolatopsis sp. NPDC026612 TaxID=3155466 RepID=UPI0033D58C84
MPSSSFLTRFAARVERTPSAPALSAGDRTVSYAGLARLAGKLGPVVARAAGAVCVPPRKSPETVALVLACLAGGKQVLLPPAELGSDALVDLCGQAGCSAVLAPDGEFVRLAGVAARPAGSGLLLTTSGTTGPAKTVVLDAAGLDRFFGWASARFGIGPGVTTLSCVPLNFDLSLLDVWAALAAGARAELAAPEAATGGADLADACGRADVVQLSPMHLRMLTESAPRPLPGVRHVISTGDVLPPRLAAGLPALFPRARLWNLYGSTETNDSFLGEVDVEESLALGAVPLGDPIAGVEATVAGEHGETVTGAGRGELLVATPFQARGYLDRRRGGLTPIGRPFRTGDLVERDERGRLFVRGRRDDQVKVRGARTNLHQVQEVILRHTDVVDALVTATADPAEGHRISAAVRLRPRARLTGLQLRVYCRAKLPATAVPSSVEIVEHRIGRSANGKRQAVATPKEGILS